MSKRSEAGRQQFLDEIYQAIQDGIIVMDHDRTIAKMNPAAQKMTGWKIGGKVPYCSFCEKRELHGNEGRCFLIARDEVPYFLSEMPTYHGDKIDVEMSTALIFQDEGTDEKYYLLVLRDQSLKKKEEEARISKLMLKKLIEVKESEHKRLAQELHDNVGQSLYSVAIALDNIINKIADHSLHEYVKEVRQELGRVMEDVKLYSHQLRPKSLDQLGLVPTVEGLVHSLGTKMPTTKIEFNTTVNNRFHPLIEINLYRVIQEALHNMMKHSRAKNVTIELTVGNGEINLIIQDDGVGFNMDETKEGLGLKHIEERVSQLGGIAKIYSKKNLGVTIAIMIPEERGELHDDNESNDSR
jgi:two-component system sensor histidine kinase NreB